MATAKAYNGSVVNGGAAVCPGYGGGTYFTVVNGASHASGDGLIFNQVANSKYLTNAPLSPSSADCASGTNAEACVYLGKAGYGRRHALYQVGWGYASTPTSGFFQVESPSGTVIYGPLPVTASGPGVYSFAKGLRGAVDADMRVVLTPAGSGVVGKVSVGSRGSV